MQVNVSLALVEITATFVLVFSGLNIFMGFPRILNAVSIGVELYCPSSTYEVSSCCTLEKRFTPILRLKIVFAKFSNFVLHSSAGHSLRNAAIATIPPVLKH
jgi:hypothetical protein